MPATIGKEAMKFVRACETSHAWLATGNTLAPDDRSLIVFSGRELLSQLKATEPLRAAVTLL